MRRCRAEGVSCWEQAPTSCNQRQHLYETDGWDETWRHLKAAIESQGPFDGIMGFSQVAVKPARLRLAAVLPGRLYQQQVSSIPFWPPCHLPPSDREQRSLLHVYFFPLGPLP